MRVYGDLYGFGHWAYLLGVDQGYPWISQVPVTVKSLDQALGYLKPVAVKTAEAAGLRVVRQGDWFFIPVDNVPAGTPLGEEPLDDDHIAENILRLKTRTYVSGSITHHQHDTVHLPGWHQALQNRAIRNGRFGQGKDCD